MLRVQLNPAALGSDNVVVSDKVKLRLEISAVKAS